MLRRRKNRPYKDLTEDDKNKVVSLYKKNDSVSFIAFCTDLSSATVSRILKESGLEIRQRRMPQITLKGSKK